MIPIKRYIANQFIGKTFHFKCDCVIPIDVVGEVKDAETIGSEIVLLVNTGSHKLLHIGLNTTSLVVEEV
jgi:hypothetical protein